VRPLGGAAQGCPGSLRRGRPSGIANRHPTNPNPPNPPTHPYPNPQVGDVIYIEANSGAVKRVGRCDAYATEFDLEAEEYVPLPKVRQITVEITVNIAANLCRTHSLLACGRCVLKRPMCAEGTAHASSGNGQATRCHGRASGGGLLASGAPPAGPRKGGVESYAPNTTLHSEKLTCVTGNTPPKGDVHKRKEIVQDVTLHDLDSANARPQGGQVSGRAACRQSEGGRGAARRGAARRMGPAPRPRLSGQQESTPQSHACMHACLQCLEAEITTKLRQAMVRPPIDTIPTPTSSASMPGHYVGHGSHAQA
jgi:hypothetical protein